MAPPQRLPTCSPVSAPIGSTYRTQSSLVPKNFRLPSFTLPLHRVPRSPTTVVEVWTHAVESRSGIRTGRSSKFGIKLKLDLLPCKRTMLDLEESPSLPLPTFLLPLDSDTRPRGGSLGSVRLSLSVRLPETARRESSLRQVKGFGCTSQSRIEYLY